MGGLLHKRHVTSYPPFLVRRHSRAQKPGGERRQDVARLPPQPSPPPFLLLLLTERVHVPNVGIDSSRSLYAIVISLSTGNTFVPAATRTWREKESSLSVPWGRCPFYHNSMMPTLTCCHPHELLGLSIRQPPQYSRDKWWLSLEVIGSILVLVIFVKFQSIKKSLSSYISSTY